jgi:hypothetical protein
MSPIASFLGGVLPPSPEEENLAHQAGRCVAELGYTFQHGGYNGLMEHAARGAAEVGTPVVAVTLQGKQAWGPFNPHVANAVYAPDMGARLNTMIGGADLVIAMGGGVGTLHELTAALWYAGNIRQLPVVAAGAAAIRLIQYLRAERWLYESPTRPLDFLHSATTEAELRTLLNRLASRSINREARGSSAPFPGELTQRLMQTARVNAPYQLESGETLTSYFDPFRITADPALARQVAVAMAAQISGPADAVAGIALGGVVLAANLAAELRRPLLIVRPTPKQHGPADRPQIEGVLTRGHRVIIVDDVVRTGRSVLQAVSALSQAGLSISLATCVIERPGAARSVLRQHGIPLTAMIMDETGAAVGNGYYVAADVSR